MSSPASPDSPGHPRLTGGAPRDEVYRITSAAPGLSDDQRMRTKRYLISMTIRTLCFLGAVLAPSPWRWVLLVGALVLPYVAVVMANVGDRRPGPAVTVVVRPDRPALGGPEPPPAG